MKNTFLFLLAFIIPAISMAAPVSYSGVIPVFTINAGSMTVQMDDTAVRASTGAITVNLNSEIANRVAGDAAIGVTTAALNTAKLSLAGGMMTGVLNAAGIYNSGTSTATVFYGSGAGLTTLPSASLTGALPALSGASLTALTAANISAGSLGAGVIASSVAVGSVANAALAGSIDPAKITGTAAILGANTFTGAQSVQAKVTVSTAATSQDSLCFVGAVATLPTTGYNRGCLAYLTSDPTKLYISTQTVVGTFSWLAK